MTNFTQKAFSLFIALLLVVGQSIAQDPFWTEDFDGGLPTDWQTVVFEGTGGPFSDWLYTTSGPSGSFATAPINSTSAGNGWMIFDSDADCTPNGSQDAWLISPAINCEDKLIVWIQFETFYRSFNDRPQVMVGTDINDFDSWSSLEVFPGIESNQYSDYTDAGDENPSFIQLDLSAVAAGQAEVYFAFRFQSDATTANGGSYSGCAYNWQVDDVGLIDFDPRPPHDLNLGLGSIAPNAVYPLSNVEPIYFLGDFSNDGSEDQTNSTLAVEVSTSGTPVFDASLNYGTVEPDSFATLQIIPDPFLPTITGTYDVTYSLFADSTDVNLGNNTDSYTFIVNDTSFQKETIANGGAVNQLYPNNPVEWDNPDVLHQWAIGNAYYVTAGAGNYLRYVTFAIEGTNNNAGEFLEIKLYAWDDSNGDGILNFNERETPAGATIYTVTGDEQPGELVTIPFINISTQDYVELEDETQYILMLEHTTQVTDDSKQILVSGSDARDYFPMAVAYANFVGDIRYASVVGVNDNVAEGALAGTDFTLDLWSLVPVVRMSIGEKPAGVGTIELLDAANLTKAFPTPAADWVTLDMQFTDLMEQVDIRVWDLSGRVYTTQQFHNVKEQQFRLDVTNMPNGAYFFEVLTEKGIRAVNFMVQH